jgi:hypothetical protein
MGEQHCACCRNEFCEREELHAEHQDFSEEIKNEARKRLEPKSKGKRLPWKRPAPKALDHSIVAAVSYVYPKHLDAILRDVEDDYGSGPTRGALYRAVGRHLSRLVARGQVLRVDLGRQLYAYLKPGSSLVNDVELMREQIQDMIEANAEWNQREHNALSAQFHGA